MLQDAYSPGRRDWVVGGMGEGIRNEFGAVKLDVADSVLLLPDSRSHEYV